LLFDGPNAVRFRRVPTQIVELSELRLEDTDWEALQLPINLAFFVRSSAAGQVIACYPSPAGATESPVTAEAWESLKAAHPAIGDMLPDVEALLVNRIGDSRDHFRLGVDQCYRLVGLIRSHWRGLSGGATVWGEVAGFFTGLRERIHA
jgi:hypothetical protein